VNVDEIEIQPVLVQQQVVAVNAILDFMVPMVPPLIVLVVLLILINQLLVAHVSHAHKVMRHRRQPMD
jgi:hypothetical protein